MHFRRQAYVVGALLACVLLPLAAALEVNPHSQQLNSPGDEVYTFVYSIVNSDPQPRTLQLRLDPFSMYLDERVSLNKEEFALLPGQAENIQLSVQPQGLGPQTHSLKIGIYDGAQRIETFELLIVVPGTPVEDYKVALEAGDTHSDNAVPLTVTLSNYGNVIGYAKLALEIRQRDAAVGSIAYPELIQVLPNDKVVYDLVYTDQLEPGFYTAHMRAAFASEELAAEDQFSVQLEQSRQRLEVGSDLVLTFASLGNPASVQYSLTDSTGTEVAAGTFLQHTGDVVVPTSALPAGDYELSLDLPGGTQRIAIVIRDPGAQMRLLLIVVVAVVILYAVYSLRGKALLLLRLFLLERAIAKRQEEVANLINRSHRLVDEYATHARRRQSGAPRETDEGPR